MWLGIWLGPGGLATCSGFFLRFLLRAFRTVCREDEMKARSCLIRPIMKSSEAGPEREARMLGMEILTTVMPSPSMTGLLCAVGPDSEE